MRAGMMTTSGGEVVVEDVEMLEGGPRDVMVRITASGVCRSDLSFARGYLGDIGAMVLGHEGVGVVERIGPGVRGLKVGDRVIASGIPACGDCWYCLHDKSNLCSLRVAAPRVRRADGSSAGAVTGLGTFAERMTVDFASVVRVGSDLPDEQLALIGCGVSTGVGAALNTARVEPGSAIAVIGCGGVGQAVIQGAVIAGAAKIIAIDPIEMKRSAAISFGATDAVEPGGDGGVQQVKQLTSGRGADYVFDVVGTAGTVPRAVRMARRGGLIIVVGMPRITDRLQLPAWDLVMTEKRISGSVYGSTQVRRDFARYVALAESGSLKLGAMVTQRITLDDVPEALEGLERGEVIRSVVIPS